MLKKFTSSRNFYQLQSMLVQGFESLKAEEDANVDILEISRGRDLKVEAKEDPDGTEYSSSFADTISGNENASSLSDAEVESQFIPDIDLAPAFDGFGSVFPIRKKKLTAHWRNFIHPLMWRCKWTELRIKELESKASKYAKEVSIIDCIKHMPLDKRTAENYGSKSLPFPLQSHRKRPLKRMKRKRVEATTDITSYMSNHILFSERENKRPDFDGVPTWENHGNSDKHASDNDEFGLHEEYTFHEENGNFLEHILGKIDLVQTRVHKLRTQLDVVLINNASRFSSSENLSQLVGGDIRSPTFSACNGDTVGLYASPQYIDDYDIGDFVIPDCGDSSFGEAIAIPDIIESTVGLLSSIDVTQHHAQIGDSSEKIVDNILIHNEAAEAENSAFKYNHNQSADKAQAAENSGEGESNRIESEMEAKTTASPKEATLKSCLTSQLHFPKNKRKRGERKAGSGNWSRQ